LFFWNKSNFPLPVELFSLAYQFRLQERTCDIPDSSYPITIVCKKHWVGLNDRIYHSLYFTILF